MAKIGVVRESKVERLCCEYAGASGWWSSKYVAPGKNGVPDRIFIKSGFVFFCEFKRPGETPTRQQLVRHKQMRSFGATVIWVDNIENFKKQLKAFEQSL